MIGTSVMKEVDKRTTKWQQYWESPFCIAKYNNEMKSYSLKCIDGKVLEAEVPIVQLKVIPGEMNLFDIYEFKKILDNQGKDGKKEYLVKWKYYDETSWQSASDFLTNDVIQEYNVKWKKSIWCVKKK